MLFDGLSVFENICVPQIIKGGQVLQMENRAVNLCELFGIEHIRKNTLPKYLVEKNSVQQ